MTHGLGAVLGQDPIQSPASDGLHSRSARPRAILRLHSKAIILYHNQGAHAVSTIGARAPSPEVKNPKPPAR